MQLLTLGVNHHTAPLAIREQVAFGPEKLGLALRELTQNQHASEAAILSTCNRTELYVNTPSPENVTQWLADFHHIERRELAPYLYALPREKAAQHAFRVASGLDSMVLGEPQILGQFKERGALRRGGRHAGLAAQQTVPAHLLGGEDGAQRNRHRRQHGVDGGCGGAAGRAHLSEHCRAEHAVHRRRRNDRTGGDAFRRASSAAHDRLPTAPRPARSNWPTAISAM